MENFHHLPKNLFDHNFNIQDSKNTFLGSLEFASIYQEKHIRKTSPIKRTTLRHKNKSSNSGFPNTCIPLQSHDTFTSLHMVCRNLAPTTYKIVRSSSFPRNKIDVYTAHKYMLLIPKLH